MAKRKKTKASKKKEANPNGKSRFSVPEGAKGKILGVVLFVVTLILVFSFFEKAGGAGALLFSAFLFLFGKAVFILPLFLVIAGLVLFAMKRVNVWIVALALALLVAGAGGMLGTAARSSGVSVQGDAGLIGLLVSWPAFAAFGFWVSEIIFGALLAISGIIFWQLLPHDSFAGKKASLLAQGAKEKVKKIFEPKFEIKEVEEEPRVHTGTAEEQGVRKEKAPVLAKENLLETFPLSGDYKFPSLDLLEGEQGAPSAGDVKVYSAIIKKTLGNFDIPVEISEINIGPTVTQYAFKPGEGIKLARITALSNDLALALAAHPIRIEAPIPGRSLVGIEIPNAVRAQVRLKNLMESEQFKTGAPLLIPLGKDVSGSPVFADLARMPHILVAGATGTGKTIALNNIILSLIYRNPPSNVRFILVDPKRVEFPIYNALPHLLTPVILDTQRTINALKWLIKEMERRFVVLSSVKVRDIAGYHGLLREQKAKSKNLPEGEELEAMPYIILIIDELADLMASRGKEMEGMIVRLAQMARAVGIHLVLATQRPSVEIITGLIKANITSRIAFQVASQIDSRTILDSAGAEKLLGRGDLLFLSADFSRPKRIQGAFVSDKDVKKVTQWIEKQMKDFVRDDIGEEELSQTPIEGMQSVQGNGGEEDSLYEEAKRVVVEAKKASASLLQRRLKVGYARAARLLDILEERGVIGPGDGAKPREVYVRGEGEEPGWFSP